MARVINPVKIRESYKLDPQRTCAGISEAIEAGELTLKDFSIKDMFEALVPDGQEVLRLMDRTRKGGGTWRLQEAASAVDLSAFSNITGQLLFSTIKKEFELATMVADMLVTTRQSPFPYGERMPGIGGIGDQAEVVDEGQPYPTAGVNEEYIDMPAPKKRGFIVPVTREAIVFDRTGQIGQRVSAVAKWLGLNKEKRVLDTVLGVTNTYKRNGTATNTYLSSGAYINSQANTLVDWTDVENAELLFDAIVDPNTGEPIGWQGEMTMIVPTAIRRTAHRIVHATDIRYGDGASNTTAYYAKNPLAGGNPNGLNMSGGINVISTPYIKSRSGSASTWFYGRPKDAFCYNEVWDIETSQAPTNNTAEFERDISLQYKASEFGTAAVMEPRLMTKNT